MGILERNENGATYEGIVYDRFLTLHHANGRILSIFDMGEPISTGLRTNKIYEMVLVASIPEDVEVFSTCPSPATSTWQGIVVDMAWKAARGSFSRERKGLYGREWICLATPLGNLLMNPAEIGAPINAGNCVQWKDPRLDLYAVI